MNNGECEHICNNKIPGYMCDCELGFSLDENGRNCTGVLVQFVCLKEFQKLVCTCIQMRMNVLLFHATCENFAGGYECACNKGFKGDGVTCVFVCEDGFYLRNETDTNCSEWEHVSFVIM